MDIYLLTEQRKKGTEGFSFEKIASVMFADGKSLRPLFPDRWHAQVKL